jgi:16S rRNA (uracil1498-N3)-methyltransferase
MPRFHCPTALTTGTDMVLPEGAARHVQVLRMQPGMAVTLFNGEGGEYQAEITHMGKREVRVLVGGHQDVECEAQRQVHLAVGMPANDRMDWLVEKATELGVTRITPLITQRTVLRLSGERADKKRTHWQDIAAAACEQCGRNRVPIIDAPSALSDWLSEQRATHDEKSVVRAVLSLHPLSHPMASHTWPAQAVLLSGPEGGLSDEEDAAARAAGFMPVSLGNRTLRAETAALAALAYLTVG